MKLFGKSPKERQPSAEELAASLPPPKLELSLSAEQKAILENAIDSRGDKILKKLYGDRAAAEKALKAGVGPGNIGNRRVVQDANGFWRIADGPAPEGPVNMLDGL